jgi:hypothetical protein
VVLAAEPAAEAPPHEEAAEAPEAPAAAPEEALAPKGVDAAATADALADLMPQAPAPPSTPSPPKAKAAAEHGAHSMPVSPAPSLLRDATADSCLLDPTAAPPPQPADYPYMARAPAMRLHARCRISAARYAVGLGLRAHALTPFAPQTALLDVVRQSHIVAGAAVGVAAGLAFSLRALRRK